GSASELLHLLCSCAGPHRDPPSFPTRRSSDLPSEPEDGGAAGEATAAEEESEQSGGGQSGSWPLVEDEDGNIVENPEDEDPEWGSSDDGDYTFSLTDEPFFAPTSDGAFITMTMDAQTEDDDEIAWLEQYRGDVGAEPVTYEIGRAHV